MAIAVRPTSIGSTSCRSACGPSGPTPPLGRKHFDDFFIAAGSAGIRQAVILAAGLDARAWRLPWVADTVVYEIDQPKVLEFKSETLRAHGAKTVARDVAVAVDLRQDWPAALRAAGFDASEPTRMAGRGAAAVPARGRAGPAVRAHPTAQRAGQPDRRGGLRIGLLRRGVPAAAPGRRCRRCAIAVASAGHDMSDVTDLFYNEPRTDVADWLAEHGWEVDTLGATELLSRHKRAQATEMLANRSVFVEARRLTGP